MQGHVWLLINQRPQVLLHRAAFNLFSSNPVLVLGMVLTQAQDFVFGLAELHEIYTGPPIKLVEIPLAGIPSLQLVD